MPPKAKFTREEMINAALDIVREDGIDGITARELGRRLGSSACPVFTVFENMEEVNREIEKEARVLYKAYVKEGLKQAAAFRGVGTAYVKFAMEEPKLFQLLFMTEKSQPKDIDQTLMMIDESYEEILESVKVPYELTEEEAKRLYHHLWIYTHGIATLCATKVCIFTPEEIQEMLTEIFVGIFEKIKKER